MVKDSRSELKYMYLTNNFAITEFKFHCNAFFLFFTLSLELLNGLRSAVG